MKVKSVANQRSSDTAELLAKVADKFLQAAERGEQPDVDEFARRYPEIGAILRDVLPALTLMKPSLSGDSNPSLQGEGRGEGETGILGDFRLVREIGRGGMGVVYEAEQISLGRTVALKVLPFAAMLDSRQLTRFRNEARAAAALHHNNIVPVFSVGCERGVHYYAMQYIEGESLATVIAALAAELNGEPRASATGGVSVQESVHSPTVSVGNSASPLHPFTSSPVHEPRDTEALGHLDTLAGKGQRTRDKGPLGTSHSADPRAYFRNIAELGIQAAEALDHAHEQGVIHRDIKPANLLLDETGRLWIADFGLARLEADAGMTMTGDLVGTLRYMSPEQALAKRVVVDHRTDIYSLGITLYELLALRPAFDGEDRQHLLKQIAFEDAPHLRKVNREIPAEFETIVEKAIRKNPAERYATARDLAEDLRSFLANKPIKAKPPTWREQVLKWSRRHPAAVRATAVAGLLTLAVIAASLGWIARDRATRQAILNQQITQALEEAKTWYEAGKLAEATSTVKRADALLAGGGSSDEIKQRVDQWRDDLQTVQSLEKIRVDQASPAVPSQDRGPGGKYNDELGWSDRTWNREGADQAYRQEFRRYGVNLEAPDFEKPADRIKNSLIKMELVAALDDWYQVTTTANRNDAPNTMPLSGRKELLQIARLVDPDPWRDRLRDAIQRGDTDLLARLANEKDIAVQPVPTVLLLVRALHSMDANDSSAEGTKILQQVQRQHPADFWVNFELANCLPSDRLADEVAFRRVTVALRPDSPGALMSLGVRLLQQGNTAEGERLCRDVIRLNPDDYSFRFQFASSLRIAKRHAEAESVLREAIRLRPDSAEAYSQLHSALASQAKYVEAEAACREAVRLKPNVFIYRSNLSNCLALLGKSEAAEVEAREGVRMNPHLAESHVTLAYILARRGKNPEAEAHFREVVRLKPQLASGHAGSSLVLSRQDKIAEAEPFAREAVRLKPDDSTYQADLSIILSKQGKFADVEELWRNVSRGKPDDGIAHREIAVAMLKRAQAAGESPPWDQAAAEWVQAIELSDDTGHSGKRLALCREAAQWDEVFDRVAKLRPDDTALWIGHGQYRALRSQWSEASGDYAKVIHQRPSAGYEICEYAYLLVLQNDIEGYQRFCRKLLLDRQGGPQDAIEAMPARPFLAGPSEAVDSLRLVDWATQAVKSEPTSWRLHILGLAQYRAAHYEQAIESLHKSNTTPWEPSVVKAQNWLVMAMAHHRLEHSAEAQQCLATARKLIDGAQSEGPNKPVNMLPVDWIPMQVLLREAEALLGSSAVDAQPTATDDGQRNQASD